MYIKCLEKKCQEKKVSKLEVGKCVFHPNWSNNNQIFTFVEVLQVCKGCLCMFYQSGGGIWVDSFRLVLESAVGILWHWWASVDCHFKGSSYACWTGGLRQGCALCAIVPVIKSISQGLVHSCSKPVTTKIFVNCLLPVLLITLNYANTNNVMNVSYAKC